MCSRGDAERSRGHGGGRRGAGRWPHRENGGGLQRDGGPAAARVRATGAGVAGRRAGGADGLSHGTVRARPGLRGAEGDESREQRPGCGRAGDRAGGSGAQNGAEVVVSRRNAARWTPPFCCPVSGWRSAHVSRVAQFCAPRKRIEALAVSRGLC